MKAKNVAVYGLAESVFRSGYAMMDSPPTEEEFNKEASGINGSLYYPEFFQDNNHIKRSINLANSKGGGHNQFLTGIIVQFDLTFSNKAWVEAERYTFLDFITSMSTMHRIAKFNIRELCNAHVNYESIKVLEKLQGEYWNIPDENIEEKKLAYLQILYNLPSGFEITAGMTTNYRCLRNIYEQRRQHRLPDWQEFCDWVETLPMAKELITGGVKK
jgi:hypothetical protein